MTNDCLSTFYLENRGVNLFCKKCGQGPALLFIHGIGVDCDFFCETTKLLSSFYTVFSYDRRGYSRSGAPMDGDYSIESQTEDILCLIQHIGQPCYIVAHSAGAVFALEFAAQYPEYIRGLILHEPPVLDLLPPQCDISQHFHSISTLIHEKRYLKAAADFLRVMEISGQNPQCSEAEFSQIMKNLEHGMQYEFNTIMQYNFSNLCLNGVPSIFGVGDLSKLGHQAVGAEGLSERLSCRLVHFPGAHNSAHDFPFEFAAVVLGILSLLSHESTLKSSAAEIMGGNYCVE